VSCKRPASKLSRHAAQGISLVGIYVWLLSIIPCNATEIPPTWEVHTPHGILGYDLQRHVLVATNGVVVRYGDSTLVADQAVLDQSTGEAQAEGNVRIYHGQQVWVAESVRYNFKTRQMETRQFRTGKFPVFVAAANLTGDITNRIYIATNAIVTTDDVDSPYTYLTARYIKIISGEKIVAYNAVLYLGGIPILYTPYYTRQLAPRSSHFSVTPGYRSAFGPFLLGSYNWAINTNMDATIKLDYRLKRGVGTGFDFDWDRVPGLTLSGGYYYLSDEEPELDLTGRQYDRDRHYAYGNFLYTPASNSEMRASFSYQSDSGLLREFFESKYRDNPKPPTYVEAVQSWDNFSLAAGASLRLNDFQETVERLPEIRFSAYPQRIFNTPIYYESYSSVAYLHRRFAETNGPLLPRYEGNRADTFHQISAPFTLFQWLNVTPKMGDRVTWYSKTKGPGAVTTEEWRNVFNTGVELNCKLWRSWPTLTNRLLQLDGLRHIIEPSVTYVFVPEPNRTPDRLPQFDYAIASEMLTPIEFPEYSAIDSIDSQNVIRLGLANTLQTKRTGVVEDFFSWKLLIDWRLDPNPGQNTFSDLYSSLVIVPRPWLKLYNDLRYDTEQSRFNLVRNTVLMLPGPRWAWAITYYYLRDDLNPWPTGLGPGTHALNNIVEYRFDENWSFRTSHYFDLNSGEVKEHVYTVQRDLRSWTAALAFRVRDTYEGKQDYGVSLMLSLKAWPRTRSEASFETYSTLNGS